MLTDLFLVEFSRCLNLIDMDVDYQKDSKPDLRLEVCENQRWLLHSKLMWVET